MEDTENEEDSRKQSVGVDPDELTARLLALGGSEQKAEAEELPPVPVEEEEALEPEEMEEAEDEEEEESDVQEETLELEESEKLPEEKECIVFDGIESSSGEEADDDVDTEGSFIVYGNVKMYLCGSQVLEDPVTSRDEERKLSGISRTKDTKLAVESVWWKDNVGCGKCPSKFNCTCDMSIVDIVRNLATYFDVVVIPDNTCITCLQVLDIIRERNVVFCQVNLEDIEERKREELRLYLTGEAEGAGLLHHWTHAGEVAPEEVEILGRKERLPAAEYYDLVMVGTSSVAAGIAEEAEKLGMSLCLVEVDTGQSRRAGSSYSYVDSLKLVFQEAVEVQKSLKHAKYTGIADTESAFFSWDAFRLSAQKLMKTHAWKHRISLHKKGIVIVSGSATIVNRNTIKVKQRLGDVVTVRGKNIVITHHCKMSYQHFSGFHRYCLPVERLLYSQNLDVSRTLVYGPATSTLEYAEIFNSLGLDVTVMMYSDFPANFDKDMIDMLISYMSDTGMEFIRNTELCHVALVPRGANNQPAIPNATERLIAIARNLKTWEYSVYFFDNVIVLPREKGWTPLRGLREIGVKFSKFNPDEILVDDNFRTAVRNVFAVTGREDCWQTSKKFYEVTGKYFVQYVQGLRKGVLRPDLKFGLLSTRPEYGFYGLSEAGARKAYPGEVRVYHADYNPWNVFSLASQKPPSYIKLICRERTSSPGERKVEDIVGLHVLGRRSAGNIVRGFSFAMSEGLTKEALDCMVGVQYSSAEALIDMDILKEENDPPLGETTCFSRRS